jgi:flagellar biogenesis protein FliO
MNFLRRCFTVAISLTPILAQAQANLGTRTGGGFNPVGDTPGFGIGALVQMLIALGIVGFLLKWLLPKLAGKWLDPAKTKPGKSIVVLESTPLGATQLHLLEVQGQKLLIAATSTTTSLLKDFSHPSNVITTHLIGPADSTHFSEDEKSETGEDLEQEPFEKILFSEEAAPPLMIKPVNAQDALERLTRIAV